MINSHTDQVVQAEKKLFEPTLQLSELPNQLDSFLLDHGVFKQQYQEVTVIHQNEMFSLVPTALFDKSCLKDYLKYNTQVLKGDEIVTDSIAELEINTVYIPYSAVNNMLLDRFNAFEYLHQCSVILRYLQSIKKSSNEKLAYVYISNNKLSLAIFNENKLLLYNEFDIYNSDDLIYYLLFSIEQVKLTQDEVQLNVFGDIHSSDTLYIKMTEFIANVHLFIPPIAYNFANNISANQVNLISLIT